MNEVIQVLIVDDRINVRQTVRNSLYGLNCRFSEAECGEDALALIRDNNFDVIFLDLRLPDINGIETYRKAKQIKSEFGKVIILTGYPEIGTVHDAGRLGAFQYLIKAEMNLDTIRGTFKAALGEEVESRNLLSRENIVCITSPTDLPGAFEYAIKPVVESFGMECRQIEDIGSSGENPCKVCSNVQACKLAIIDLSDLAPNAFIDIGLAIGQGKKFVLLKKKDKEIPDVLAEMNPIEYSDLSSLKKSLENSLEALLK
jgi:CheY-like chemotaxis protein